MTTTGLEQQESPPARGGILRQLRAGRLLLLAAFVCALVIYLPTLRFGYLLDDDHLIAGNPRLQTWSSIPYFFSHQLWPGVPYYRPLTLTAFLAISKLFGAQPWIFHLYDVILFLIVVGMIYHAARVLEFSEIAAAWAALLFAVHPAHLEIGAWITGSTESLLAIPLLAALCCYVRARQAQQRELRWLAAALCFFAIALLAKELAVVLPLLLILWEVFAGKTLSLARRALRILPFIALTIPYLALRTGAVGTLSATITPLPLKTELLTIPSIIAFYANRCFVPRTTSFFYDTYYVTSAASPQFLVPLAFVVGIVFFIWYPIKRGWLTRGESFCILAAIIALLPSLNFSAFVWRELAHDRYIYLTSIFLGMAASGILLRAYKSTGHGFTSVARLAAGTILAVMPFAFTIQSSSQSYFYSDEFIGFVHSAQVAPNNLYVIRYLIGALHDRGYAQEAQSWLDRLNQVTPSWWYFYEFAQTSLQHGDLQQAEKLARQAIAMQAQPESHRLLAVILEQEGKCAEAKAEWKLSYYPRPQGLVCASS